MGGAQSNTCTHTVQNPDLLSVVTLSDAAVQRLPLDVEDNPLDKEQRNKNVDDFWRDRLKCLEDTFDRNQSLTEKDFNMLENAIKRMAPGRGKIACPRVVEDTTTCYLVNSKHPLNCTSYTEKLELCMDLLLAEAAKKQLSDEKRKAKKKVC